MGVTQLYTISYTYEELQQLKVQLNEEYITCYRTTTQFT